MLKSGRIFNVKSWTLFIKCRWFFVQCNVFFHHVYKSTRRDFVIFILQVVVDTRAVDFHGWYWGIRFRRRRGGLDLRKLARRRKRIVPTDVEHKRNVPQTTHACLRTNTMHITALNSVNTVNVCTVVSTTRVLFSVRKRCNTTVCIGDKWTNTTHITAWIRVCPQRFTNMSVCLWVS